MKSNQPLIGEVPCMKRQFFILCLVGILFGWIGETGAPLATADARAVRIVSPSNASGMETLAAKEIRRYLYQRTGVLAEIVSDFPGKINADIIVVAQKDRSLAGDLGDGLAAQQYRVKTVKHGSKKLILIVGGDDAGTLYGAYRFAEGIGVRFYLDGDLIPDERAPLQLPDLNETGKPLFETRGVQPFHDFPEGPDWWNEEEYKAIISQLPKLRMNFIGLHTYPEERPYAEPTVWIGLERDSLPNGDVRFSYPSSYLNTVRGERWGYIAKKTSDYTFGAADLFEFDAYGPDVMGDSMPLPKTMEQCNAVFDRTGRLLREAFEHAHRLAVKTCVGMETPLVIPQKVQERVRALGMNPSDPATIRKLYEGTFKRISAAYPLDYFWFWTPEGWTWEKVKPEQIEATKNDLTIAMLAAQNAGVSFTLATCGWVLGPESDRSLFDRLLPKTMPMSCINRQVGKSPVEPSFQEIQGRPLWAIPWLEDDPALLQPQLWVGRMRADAVDALKYGCTGLLGIHWRTRILGPNVSALAAAAWEQQDWGQAAAAAKAKIENATGETAKPRHLESYDFYLDWARHSFGDNAAGTVAKVFAALDGKFPCPVDWVDGPGGLKPDSRPWKDVQKDFAFLRELESISSLIEGKGNQARFDYWLRNFQFLKYLAETNCIWGEMNQIIEDKVKNEPDQSVKTKLIRENILPIANRMLDAYSNAYRTLLPTISNTGELGTICNLEQHVKDLLITRIEKQLSEWAKESVSLRAPTCQDYDGPARLIVPTLRSSVAPGEPFALKVILLDQFAPRDATLYWREMGKGAFQRIPLVHLRRGVYKVEFPSKATTIDCIEYYVKVRSGSGETLYFPATAPSLNQTVVVAP